MLAVGGLIGSAFRIAPDEITEITTPPTGIWVPSSAAGEIVFVDASSARVAGRVAIPDAEGDLHVHERDDAVVVFDAASGRVTVVDPALREVVRTIEAMPANGEQVDISDSTVAIGSGSTLAVVDLDAASVVRAPVGSAVRSVAATADGAVAVVADGIARLDADGEVAIDEGASGVLVRAGDRVGVVSTERILSVSGETTGCFASPVGSPDFAAGAPDGMVAVVDGTRLHVSTLGTRSCQIIDLDIAGRRLGQPVIAGGLVYVPDRSTSLVHVVDPTDGTITAARTFAASDLRVRGRDRIVAAYDAASSFIVLVDRDGRSRLVDTSRGLAGVSTELVDGTEQTTFGGDDDAPTIELNPGEAPDGLGQNGGAGGVEASRIREIGDQGSETPSGNELTAFFASSAAVVLVDQPVRFVDDSTGRPDSWRWDFGDGAGAEGPEAFHAWSQTGSYEVVLTIGRGELSDTFSQIITVVPVEEALPPNADFVASATVVNVGDEVLFEDRSSGDIDRWGWDFGDGDFSDERSPRHAWDEPGRYTVQLTVANDQGVADARQVIEVRENLVEPVADISVDQTEVELGAAIRLVGRSLTDPAQFRWDFGDGRTSVREIVDHVFLQEGRFTVTLTAENDAGSSEDSVVITVVAPTERPEAVMAALPAIIEVGETVTFSSLSTNRPDAENWTFGDGESATGRVVTHAWTQPGLYLVRLTAANEAGESSITRRVEVEPALPAPQAVIDAFDPLPWVGQPVVFLDASLNATSWSWDFGDGVTSPSQNPLHTFTTPGPKTITLTVTNRNGSDSMSVVVDARLQPEARFAASSTAIRAGDTVSFTDQSVNAVAWRYDFGDGDTSTAPSPSHTFDAVGNYNVVLEVESATGDIDSFGPLVISVDPAAPALAAINRVPDDGSPIITLESLTIDAEIAAGSGPIAEYEVTWGDGAVEANATGTFSHVYTTSGSFDVSMRARGPLGDWSPVVERTFTVEDPPPPAIAINAAVPAAVELGATTLTGDLLAGSGPVDSWRWVISGPVPDVVLTGQVVTHTFTQPGNYTLTLTAEGPVDSASVSQPIVANVPPPPLITSLAASPSVPTVGQTVSFTPVVTGAPSTYEWSYEGAAFVAGGPVGAHVFNTAGTADVVLRVADQFGGDHEFSITITVNAAPSPTAPVVTPASPIPVGTTATITSSDAGGRTGLTWNWTITDGVTTRNDATSTPSLTHLFDTAGDFTVTVQSVDSQGVASVPVVSFVTVLPPPLDANFGAASVGPGVVQLTDLSTGPAVETWSWDFGDLAASGDAAAANPTVTYPLAGTYSVTLTVTGAGQSDSVVLLVTVS